METLHASSISELLDSLSWDIPSLLFRGVADIDYDLVPSIARLKSTSVSGLALFEQSIVTEFARRAPPFLSSVPQTTFQWLFLAQHYGLPTRLLDWTTNPLVALYFASAGDSQRDFAVYRDIQRNWITNILEDPFSVNEISAIRPHHADIRYVNQEGVFSVHPLSSKAYRSKNLCRYVFDGRRREEIQWSLRKIGYSRSRIFPGLESIARDVCEELDFHLNNGTVRYKRR